MNSKPLNRDLEYVTLSLVSVTSFNLRMRLSLGLRIIIVLPVYCIIMSYKTLIYERKTQKNRLQCNTFDSFQYHQEDWLVVSQILLKAYYQRRCFCFLNRTEFLIWASAVGKSTKRIFCLWLFVKIVLSPIEAIGSCAISRNFKENCWQRGKHMNSACV